MKKIEAIVRPGKLDEIKEALNKAEINGMTISQVIGCGHQKGRKEILRGQEINIYLLPKVKLDIVVNDNFLERTINILIEHGRIGEIGDGKIFVSNIEEAIRIRTGERGGSVL